MNLIKLSKDFYLLLIVLIFLVQFNTGFDSEDNPQTNGFASDQQIADIKHDFDVLAKDFLESLKVAHHLVDIEEEFTEEVDGVVRSKRSTQYQRQRDSFFEKGVFRLKGIVPLMPTCDRPLDFTTIAFNSQTYGICVTAPSDGHSARVNVGAITPTGWERNQISLPVMNPKNVVSFVDEDKDTKERNLYVLVADAARSDGTDVHVINRFNKQINKEQHTVHSQYPTAIAIWKSRTDNTYHLAIANSFGPKPTQTFKSETFTYNWMRTYFDRYSEMTTYLVRDICSFNIHSNEFLAVANFKAGPNKVEVDSEIFKLDIDRKKWRSFQRIRTFGAIDWEFFTLGSDRNQQHFLAVANNFQVVNGRIKYEVNSVIYKFSEDKFVPFELLATVGATQVKSFKGPNGEFVLAVANMYQDVHLYQYNGWKFVRTSVQYTNGVMSPGVVSLHFEYLPFERTGVLFVSNPHHPSGHMFRMEFVFENPLGEWRRKSFEWCERVDQEVSRATDGLMPYFKDVFYIDQTHPIVINDDLQVEDIVVDSLSTPQIIDNSTGEELSHRLIDQLIQLNQQITDTNRQIDQIVDILSNALRTSGDQVVTAPHTFGSVDFECRPEFDCSLGRLDTKILNNDNIEGLVADVVPLNQNQKIDHLVHFQNLKVDKNIVLNGVINGFNTTNIVTKHGSHDILAPKTFAKDMTANEVVVNQINQRVINPSTVLLTTGDQVINNTISFTNGILVPNIQVNGLINGININQFFDEVVTRDGDHIIRSEKFFQYMDLKELTLKPGSTVDGVDLMKLWNEVLWTYGDQEVVSPINFTNIKIATNLIVDGLINGISIPKDVILRTQNAVISSKKMFTRPQRFDRMEVLHSINGIGVVKSPTPQLDILLKSKVQTITGQKTFDRIHLGGDTPVAGTVDGVKLSQLQRSVLYRNTTQHFDTLEIRGNANFEGGIALNTTINGRKLEDLYNNALKLTDRHIPAFPNLTIDTIHSKAVRSNSISGYDIGKDLFTRHTLQTIRGKKRFIHSIVVNNDLNVKNINGIEMNFFNDTLLRDIPQRITGHKTFIREFWAKDLTTPSINNISMSDLVLLHSPTEQVVVAPKTFNDVQVYGDLNVDSLEAEVINGVNMKELYENSLQYEKPQIVSGRLNLMSITIPKGSNLGTNFVNGVDLKKLMADAVLIDVPQTITGSKTFFGPITIEKTFFSHHFDNVTDYELKHNWLLQDSTQIIKGNVVFNGDVKVDNKVVMTVPVINRINLEVIKNNTVKVDEPAIISGQIRFDGSVISEGHIKLSGRIHGIDLDKEAVTLDGNHIIGGRIDFVDGFDVDEHLFVNGTVDGVRVEELCRYAVLKNGNQVIVGPTQVTGNLVIRGPLNVIGKVNGLDLKLFDASVLKVDEPAILRGVNHFRELITDGPVVSKQLFASIRIDELWNNYLSLSRDQIVNSQMVFLNDLTFGRNLLIKGNLFTQNATINGINLHHLDSTVLKTFGDQLITGDYTFEGQVFFDKDLNVVHRRVNGLDLINDLMIRGRNNVVNAPKVFAENIVVENELNITNGKTIAGVDISEMSRFAVMKTKNSRYRVGGHKHFQSLEVDHLKVRLINGVELSPRNLLLSVGNQVIHGLKVLDRGLRVDSEINSGTVNHINIGNLSRSLVLKGYNNTIHSVKTFKSPLTVNNMIAFGRVDGVNLNELNYFIGLPVNLRDLIVKLGIEDQKIESLQRALDHQSIQLEYYDLVSTIHSGPPLLLYYNPLTRSQHLFVSGQHLSNGCHEVNVFDSKHGFEGVAKKLFAIEANIMTSFRWKSDQFVVISNLKKTTNNEECLKLNNPSIVPFYGSGPAISQVFVFDVHQKSYKQIAVIKSESVTDLKVIEDNNKSPCLVMAIPVSDGLLGHPIVMCMTTDGKFYLRETTPLSGMDQVSIIRSSSLNRTLMASINSWQSSGLSRIAISDWSSQLSHFDHSIQSISILNPMAIHLVESRVQSLIFLFASEKKTSLTHWPLVRVFRYSPRRENPFMEVQQIKDFEVKQIESIVLDSNRILVLMLSSDRLDLYRLKGSSGFVRIDTIDVQNAENFIVANDYKNTRIDGHLIAVSLKECYAKNRHICKEETHILRSKFSAN